MVACRKLSEVIARYDSVSANASEDTHSGGSTGDRSTATYACNRDFFPNYSVSHVLVVWRPAVIDRSGVRTSASGWALPKEGFDEEISSDMKAEYSLAATWVLGGLLLTGSAMKAQTAAAKPAAQTSASQSYLAPSDQDIELLRKDPRSQKKQIIAANLRLTDKEAETFWLPYDQYGAEVVKINDTKYALVKDHAETHDTMSDEQAERYVKRMVGVDRATSDLRLKYRPMFRNVTSNKNTALFFQLEGK